MVAWQIGQRKDRSILFMNWTCSGQSSSVSTSSRRDFQSITKTHMNWAGAIESWVLNGNTIMNQNQGVGDIVDNPSINSTINWNRTPSERTMITKQWPNHIHLSSDSNSYRDMSLILSLIGEIVSSVSDIDTVVTSFKKGYVDDVWLLGSFYWLDGKCICYHRGLLKIAVVIRYS